VDVNHQKKTFKLIVRLRFLDKIFPNIVEQDLKWVLSNSNISQMSSSVAVNKQWQDWVELIQQQSKMEQANINK
jgi:hypothetical protein